MNTSRCLAATTCRTRARN